MTFAYPIVKQTSSCLGLCWKQATSVPTWASANKKAARWIESNWDYKSSGSTYMVLNWPKYLGLNSSAVRGAMLHRIYYNQKILPDSIIQKHAWCVDIRFKPTIRWVQAYNNYFVPLTTQQWNTLPANIVNI